MSTELFIGKVGEAAGVSVQTVRYYERLGLLPPPERTGSGYRVFAPEAVERLHFIRHAQAAGFRLDEIKEILRLRYAGQSPCECVRNLLAEKLQKVEREIAELRRFRRELRETLKRTKSLPRLPHKASAICPIIEGFPSLQKKVRGKGGERR